MANRIFEFLIRGHEKVIGHYKFLLSSKALSLSERKEIEERLRKEEAAYRRLIKTDEAA